MSSETYMYVLPVLFTSCSKITKDDVYTFLYYLG
jgi:hypothetical protein